MQFEYSKKYIKNIERNFEDQAKKSIFCYLKSIFYNLFLLFLFILFLVLMLVNFFFLYNPSCCSFKNDYLLFNVS